MDPVVLTLTGTFTPDGKMQVSINGPLDKPCLCLVVLNTAENIIRQNGAKAEMEGGPGIVLARGALPFNGK